jgi:protein-S-isoprenylcysteine O-methyltransferase Ste14
MNAQAAAHDIRRGVRKWAIKQVVGYLLVAAITFLAAGRLDWVGGWALVGIMVANLVTSAVILVPRRPELLVERSGLQKGTKGWDIALALLVAYGPLFVAIIAGLDVRYRWAPPLGLIRLAAAAVLVVPAAALVLWAMLSNPFFSATVRIQEERGHAVATGGPYRFVRHPGYAGAILFNVGTALALGSTWGLVPLGIFLVAILTRTALEDRTLRRELAGYGDYARRTRWGLVPGLW